MRGGREVRGKRRGNREEREEEREEREDLGEFPHRGGGGGALAAGDGQPN
jgi:hypothetical protein